VSPAFDQATDHAERIAAIENTLKNIEPKIDEMWRNSAEHRGAEKLLHGSALIFGSAIATAIVTRWSEFLAWIGHH
jgi:hypothetical protein